MKTIRPREIFNLLEDDGWSVTLPMPRGPVGLAVGMGVTLLETFLMIAIARHIKAKHIFEFGTHKGATARALKRNTEAAITTIDLEPCPGLPANIRQIVSDSRHLRAQEAFTGQPVSVNLQSFGTKYDLVFVDGGHDPETFENDTRIAYEILSPGGVIVWHDCGNPEFPHIEEYLDSRTVRRIRIAGTMLAVSGFPGI
jgi:predicted O-methyltransferase YrrM